MKRLIRISLLLMVFAIAAGMDCQGTMPPACEPNCGPPTPGSSLKIKSVAADAVNDELLISGEFGAQEGTVKINGVTLTVKSWGTPGPIQQIICDLPREAFGDVQVQVGNEFSNIAQLTKWELTLVSKTRIVANSPGSSGEHNIEFTNKFIIRSCLNNLLGAGGNFGAFASVSRASTGDLNAFGTITNPPAGGHTSPQSITYSKLPLTFKIVYPGDMVDPATDRFTASNFVCSATRGSGGGLKLLYSVAGFYQVTDSYSPSPGEHGTGYATNTYFDTSQPVLFFFDGDFNILAGSIAAKNDPNSTLEWQQAGAQSPPTN